MTTKLNISLSDEMAEEMRNAVFERKGMKKGNISEAFEEAVALWISKNVSEAEMKKIVESVTSASKKK
jgi:hypothetical protein